MFKQISVALMLSLATMAQANDHENSEHNGWCIYNDDGAER